ncbi:peptidoglycan-binding protein [Streptomyces sp. NPDC085665]|uniref:peptidoglycan-binding protein n=1 Tax=Streptomyces sp. NPDC085665 TaxID=3365735 RepID=UPI0037D89BA9
MRSRADHTNPPPTVRAGSTGSTVKGLQLTEEEPEGVFGPDAASATEFFQVKRGLPPTGVVVDARTRAELGQARPRHPVWEEARTAQWLRGLRRTRA